MNVISISKNKNKLVFVFQKLTKTKSTIENIKEQPLDEVKYYFKENFENKKLEIVACLNAEECFMRNIRVQLKKRGDLQQVLPFQIETILPYELEIAKIGYHVEDEPGGKRVILHSCKREALKREISYLNEFSIDPDWITSTSNALFCFLKKYTEKFQNSMNLYIGGDEIVLLMIQEGRLLESVAIPFKDKITAIEEKKMIRAVQFLQGIDKKSSTTHFSQLGNDYDISFLNSLIGDKYVKNEIKDKQQGVDFRLYAKEIGAGLNLVSKNPIQFRSGVDLSQKQKKAIKTKTSAFTLWTILGVSLLFFCSHYYLKYQSNEIIRNFNTILEETQIKRITPLTYSSPTQKNLLNWSFQIDELALAMQTKNPIANFHKNPIGVTEVFYWLSSLKQLDGVAKINQFSYELLEYPSIKNPLKKFVIKLNIGFLAKDETKMKEFKNFLCDKKEAFIDEKKEVKWFQEGDEHTFTFYLKAH